MDFGEKFSMPGLGPALEMEIQCHDSALFGDQAARRDPIPGKACSHPLRPGRGVPHGVIERRFEFQLALGVDPNDGDLGDAIDSPHPFEALQLFAQLGGDVEQCRVERLLAA